MSHVCMVARVMCCVLPEDPLLASNTPQERALGCLGSHEDFPLHERKAAHTQAFAMVSSAAHPYPCADAIPWDPNIPTQDFLGTPRAPLMDRKDPSAVPQWSPIMKRCELRMAPVDSLTVLQVTRVPPSAPRTRHDSHKARPLFESLVRDV